MDNNSLEEQAIKAGKLMAGLCFENGEFNLDNYSKELKSLMKVIKSTSTAALADQAIKQHYESCVKQLETFKAEVKTKLEAILDEKGKEVQHKLDEFYKYIFPGIDTFSPLDSYKQGINAANEFKKARDEYEKICGNYQAVVGKKYQPQHEIAYISTDNLTEDYIKILDKINELNNDTKNDKSENKSRIATVNVIISNMPFLLKKPEDFENVKNAAAQRAKAKPTSNEVEQFKEKQNKIVLDLYNKAVGIITNLKLNEWYGMIRYGDILEDELVGKYPSIPVEEKDKISKTAFEEGFTEKLKKNFGDEIIKFIGEYQRSDTQETLNKLYNSEYGTPEYESARKAFEDLVSVLQTKFSSGDIKIEFNEDNQTLSIKFPNISDAEYRTQVVNDNTLSKINEEKAKAKPTSNEVEQFRKKEDKIVLDVYNKAVEIITNLKLNPSEWQRMIEYSDTLEDELFDQYPSISGLDKTKISGIAFKEGFTEKLKETFGDAIIEFVSIYQRPATQEILEKLYNSEYGTPEYESARKAFEDLVSDLQTKFASGDIKIEFNEADQTLSIKFPNISDAEYRTQVVNDNTLSKINEEKAKAKPTSNEVEQFTEKEKGIVLDVYNKTVELITNLYLNPSEWQRMIEHSDALEDELWNQYPSIPAEEKDKISEAAFEEGFTEKLKKNFGDAIIEFVSIYQKSNTQEILGKLYNSEYGTPEYESARKAFEDLISGLQTKFASGDIKIEFNEADQTLSIKFPNISDAEYRTQVVNDNTLSKINEEKAKHAPTGAKEGMQKDIEEYLGIVTALNEAIDTLNQLNLAMQTDYDGLNNLENIILYEQNAKRLEGEIMRSKTELAIKGLNFVQKYSIYVSRIPEIASVKIKEQVFGDKSYEEFINSQDELIVEAEQKIIELHESKKSITDEKEIAEIDNQIKLLIKYIEAKNSLINRRIVIESSLSMTKIQELFQTRRENKKEIRKRIKDIAAGVSPKKPDSSGGPSDNPKPSKPDDNNPIDVSQTTAVVKSNKLKFNPKGKIPKVNQAKAQVMTDVDSITLTVINNGLKIKFSEELKRKLGELHAKISLVNKNKYRVRKTSEVDVNADEQELSFATKKDINPDDYKFEIRVPRSENNTRTNGLYEIELDQAFDEKGRTRGK